MAWYDFPSREKRGFPMINKRKIKEFFIITLGTVIVAVLLWAL